MRHDLGDAEPPVEIRSADMDAGARQDVPRAVRVLRALRRQPRDDEVRRAAAEIDDKGELLALELAFVGERRRDRLELSLDVAEALRLGDADQLALRPSVRLVVAGPLLADDGETMIGSLFLTEADSKAEVEAFNRADPFYEHGVWDRDTIEIRAFMKRVDDRA